MFCRKYVTKFVISFKNVSRLRINMTVLKFSAMKFVQPANFMLNQVRARKNKLSTAITNLKRPYNLS